MGGSLCGFAGGPAPAWSAATRIGCQPLEGAAFDGEGLEERLEAVGVGLGHRGQGIEGRQDLPFRILGPTADEDGDERVRRNDVAAGVAVDETAGPLVPEQRPGPADGRVRQDLFQGENLAGRMAPPVSRVVRQVARANPFKPKSGPPVAGRRPPSFPPLRGRH